MNILCTSVGNLAFPLFAESVKNEFPEANIIGMDIRDDAHGLYYCDKSYITSRRDHKNFIHELEQIIKDESINILYPLSTEDQDFYAERVNFFQELNVTVIASDISSLKIANDKYELLNVLKRESIIEDDFYPVSNLESLERAIEKLSLPCVLKERKGTGGQGTYILSDTIEKLKQDDRKFFFDYQAFQNVKEKYLTDQSFLMPYLSGDEFSVDTLSKSGQLIYAVVRKRYSSVGGLALEAEVVRNDEIFNLAKEIVQVLKLSYINNIQLKYNSNNIPSVLEINPRIPGTLKLSVEASGNYIADSIKLALNQPVAKPKEIKYGLKIKRFWSGVIYSKEQSSSLTDMRDLDV